jgi:hypothetical protein
VPPIRSASRRAIRPQYILLPFVLCVGVPTYVLSQNADELSRFHPASLALLAITAIVASTLLVALDRAQSRLPTRRYFAALVELTLFFAIIGGYLLPASSGPGMEDLRSLPINIVHVLVALLAAYALTVLVATSLRQRTYAAVVAFVAINFVLALPAVGETAQAAGTSDEDRPSIMGLSRDRNILVMSFDGLSRSAVLEVLRDRPDLTRRLRDFTLFAGAGATSPATRASIATSLYGNRDYKVDHDTEEALWASSPDRLITNRLDRAGWIVSTYGEYATEFQDRTRASSVIGDPPPIGTLALLNLGLARSLTSQLVIDGQLGYEVDGLYTNAVAALAGTSARAAMRFSAPHKPSWKEPFSATALDFEAYLGGIKAERSGSVAHFLHFTHTHFPVELDPECRWAGRDKEWFESHQNRAGLIEQTHCAVGQLADFVDRLRDLGVYDRSLIVLKSDHGEPVEYNAPDSIESFRINGHPRWGYGRYAPLLAIKDFGAREAAMTIDEHPVVLDDLARTLCVAGQIDADCSEYGGYDLRAGEWSGIEASSITMFIVKPDGTSDFRYDTHDAITIRRGSDILESLHQALSSAVLHSTVTCATGIDVRGGQALDNGRSDMTSWLTWHDRGSSYLRFTLDQPCERAHLLLEPGGPPIAEGPVTLLVNGRAVDTPREPGGLTTRIDLTAGLAGIAGDVVIELRPAVPGAAVPIAGLELDRGQPRG